MLVLAGLAAFILAWNLPNHYPPWPSFHSELLAAVALGLVFAGLCWPHRRVRQDSQHDGHQLTVERFPSPVSAWAFASMACLPVLQYFAGGLVFRGDALLGLLYVLGAALGLYGGALWAAQQGRECALRRLFATIVFGGIAANGLALAQWLRLEPASWWAVRLIDVRPFANFAQANHFGLMMVMSLVAATALFEINALRRRQTWVLSCAFFGAGALISQSRAAALALFAVAGLWLMTHRRVPTRLRWPEVMWALAAWVLLFFALPQIQAALLLTSTELSRPLEFGSRRWIYAHFATAILERPWGGYGFNQGVLALAEVAGKVHFSENTSYAHNFVLDLMTWAGVPVGGGIAIALGWWMLSWLRTDGDEKALAQRHCVFAVWLALLVQSMLEYPYAYSYFLLPAVLLAGAVAAPRSTKAQAPGLVRPVVASWWAMGLAAGAAALLVIVAADYFKIEEDFRATRFARANFIHRPKHEFSGNVVVLDQLARRIETAHYELRPGMPEHQINDLHAVARRFPELPIRMDYAKALALNGMRTRAEQELQIIRSLYAPTSFHLIVLDWEAWLKENEGLAASLTE